MLPRLALATALIAATAAPLQAQVQIGLSAFVGGYLPLSTLFDQIRLGDESGPIVVNLGQEPAPLFGGRITLRVMPQLAIDLEAGYAFSSLNTPPSTNAIDESNVLLTSLNAMWIFYEAPFSPLGLYLSAGAGLTARSGEFWRNWEGTTSFAGTFGFGLRYGLTPLIGLRFDLRDYIYSFQPTAGNFTFDAKTQNDFILTVALEFAFTPAQ